MVIDVEGIVINTKNYGDTSKIIDILTKEYGIIEDIQRCLDLMEEIILTLPEDKVYTLEVKKYWYSKKDDPYGLYRDYYGYDDDLQCFDMSKRDALDLINRQQKQLDNYSHNVKTMTKDFNEQYKIIKQQQ